MTWKVPASLLLFLSICAATLHAQNSRSNAVAELRSLGLVDPAATEALTRLMKARASFFDLPAICNGRLTTQSGVPISSSDRTSQSTLYFTPFQGSMVALYYGGRWRTHTLTERSLALSGTSGKNYDVFIYNNAGTLTLELSAAWTNDSTRADALTLQDGVLVKSSDTTRRYLGTIRTTGASTTEDSRRKRFVWNYYNRVPRLLTYSSTTSHSVSSTSFQAFNSDTTGAVEWVNGEANGYAAQILGEANANSKFGVGLDSSTSASISNQQSISFMRDTLSDFGTVSEGYHYILPLEAVTSGTVTFSAVKITGNVRG